LNQSLALSREQAAVAAIQRVRKDARDGRVTPHEAVMREMRGVIEAARREQAARRD